MSEDLKDVLPDKKDAMAGMEKLINKISGIISSKVNTNKNSEITEIHVLSDLSRSPKQIVRDIQSSVAAVYGIQLDHRLISVAQIDNGEAGYEDSRLKLANVQIITEKSKLTVKVCLLHDGKSYEGSACGVNTSSSKPHIVAKACLDAVHSFLAEEFYFSVVDVQKIKIANRDAFNVVVCFLSNHGEELLIGSSLVKHDEFDAVVRATLDSVNRCIRRVCDREIN